MFDHNEVVKCCVRPIGYGANAECRYCSLSSCFLKSFIQECGSPFAKEVGCFPTHTHYRVLLISGVLPVIINQGITHVMGEVLHPYRCIGIILCHKFLLTYLGEVGQLSSTFSTKKERSELQVLIIRDFGLIHKHWTDRNLFVEVDLR